MKRYLRRTYILFLFALALATTSVKAETNEVTIRNFKDLPLSMRNFNPVNIKYFKSNQWQGSLYKGKTFKYNYNRPTYERFKSPYYGLRAGIIVIMMNILQTDSVFDFVERFATEPNEEVNINYVKAIEEKLGYKGKIDFKDTIKVLEVVLLFEGGKINQTFYKKILKQRITNE